MRSTLIELARCRSNPISLNDHRRKYQAYIGANRGKTRSTADIFSIPENKYLCPIEGKRQHDCRIESRTNSILIVWAPQACFLLRSICSSLRRTIFLDAAGGAFRQRKRMELCVARRGM